jgi:sec-independent protein translocase protein TatC
MQYIYHHIAEIKLRFIYFLFSFVLTLLISYLCKFELLYLITRPFLELQQKFIFVDLTEALYTIIRICISITLALMILYILYQIWSFFIPSCYFSERKITTKFLVVFLFLIILEIICIYFFIFPKIFEFLSSFQINNSLINQDKQSLAFSGNSIHMNSSATSVLVIELSARIESYVKLIIQISIFILAFFQIPLFFIILYYNQLCNGYDLSANRKIVFFFCTLFSAFISPPDLLTQFFIVFILLLLFEFLVFLGLVFHYSYSSGYDTLIN